MSLLNKLKTNILARIPEKGIYKAIKEYGRLNPFLTLVGGVGGVIVITMVTSSIYRNLFGASSETDTSQKMSVVVEQYAAIIQSIPIELSGVTKAEPDITIKAQINGTIKEICKNRGSFLESGEVILSFDDRDRKARYNETKARYDQRDLEYTSAQKLSQQNFKAKNALSAAHADREAASAALKRAEQELEDSVPKAPFSAYLEEMHVVVGQTVNAGEPLATLVSLNPLYIEGTVSEKEISFISNNQKVEVIFPLLNNLTLNGKVIFVSKKANKETRSYRIRAQIDNPDYKVAAGMTGKIKVSTGKQQVHKLPSSLISLNDQGVMGIKHINANNKVLFSPINILSSSQNDMIISKINDKLDVITVGADFVTPGQIAKVVRSSKGQVNNS